MMFGRRRLKYNELSRLLHEASILVVLRGKARTGLAVLLYRSTKENYTIL
jgi:hypothetical protein